MENPGDFSQYLVVKSALASKYLFELYKIMVKNVTFASFRGAIAPTWIRPCLS